MAWTFGVCPCQCKNYPIRRKRGIAVCGLGKPEEKNRILFIWNRSESNVTQSL